MYFILFIFVCFFTIAQISGSSGLLESATIKASKLNRGDSVMASSHRDSLLTPGFMASKSFWLLGGHKVSELRPAGFQLKKSY